MRRRLRAKAHALPMPCRSLDYAGVGGMIRRHAASLDIFSPPRVDAAKPPGQKCKSTYEAAVQYFASARQARYFADGHFHDFLAYSARARSATHYSRNMLDYKRRHVTLRARFLAADFDRQRSITGRSPQAERSIIAKAIASILAAGARCRRLYRLKKATVRCSSIE